MFPVPEAGHGMILARILSGLGNQLFQYANARAESLRRKSELKLDISWFDKNQREVRAPRSFQLKRFPKLKFKIAEPDECREWGDIDEFGLSLPGKIQRGIHLAVRKVFPKKTVVTESVPVALRPAGNIYFDGYFQSEAFFADFRDRIRQDLTLPEPEKERNRELAAKLQQIDRSVCLHVRRGDYVSSPADAAVFGGICTVEYYFRALNELSRRLRDFQLVVFSDEPEWAVRNLPLASGSIVVDWNGSGDASFEDLILMSKCRHHLIANSSFSWWGAYLAWHEDQLVIAPRLWKRNFPSSKVVPEHWIILENR